MHRVRRFVAVVALVVSAGCGDHTPESQDDPTQQNSATSSTTPGKPKPAHTGRQAYRWLNDYTPSDSYSVAFVRGLSASEALRVLGKVRRDAGPLTGIEALQLQDDLTNWRTYEIPSVVWIDELGGGLVIYSPYGFRPFDRVVALSGNGLAATFTTTVELDTMIRVARNGKLVREFDPFFYDRHERKGALPEEKGLRFGSRQTPFTPSWRLLDRLTSLHVDQDWFENTPHPTYVLTGRS